MIIGDDVLNLCYFDLLKEGMVCKFLVLCGVEIDYLWWGWVDVSYDMMLCVC